jgi:pyridoxine kinase
MGDDNSGIYVRDGIPALMAGPALACADIVTPNRFELEMLAGRPIAHLGDAVTAARLLLAKGPRLVVATSLTMADGIACAAITADGAWSLITPRLPFDPAVNGAGDLLSALLLAHCLRGLAPPEALAAALSSLYGILQVTLTLGRRELALVQAQEELVKPSRSFAAIPI